MVSDGLTFALALVGAITGSVSAAAAAITACARCADLPVWGNAIPALRILYEQGWNPPAKWTPEHLAKPSTIRRSSGGLRRTCAMRLRSLRLRRPCTTSQRSTTAPTTRANRSNHDHRHGSTASLREQIEREGLCEPVPDRSVAGVAGILPPCFLLWT